MGNLKRRWKKAEIALLALVIIVPASSPAHAGARRPRILGIEHVALYVADLQVTRDFYENWLGFEEPFPLERNGDIGKVAFIKINDQQYVELLPGSPRGDGQLSHIAFYTDDAAAMRNYLVSRGVELTERGQAGNHNFTITDPDGHTVEIVQHTPTSWMTHAQGKFMPASRISQRMMHVGFTVGSLSAALKFYGEILGFQENWRGSSTGTELSWVNMRVPDGEDYVEFMLYRERPSGPQLGAQNHLSLEVPDISAALALLDSRPARKTYGRAISVRVGKNRKRHVNLFDPDGTRIELMERNTVDGKVATPSTALPPQ